MDLLFKRYASPFSYMQVLLEMRSLKKGLMQVIDQDNEDKLWQLYLSIKPKESFDDWKDRILQPNTKAMTKEEVEEQVKIADDILKSFSIERSE